MHMALFNSKCWRVTFLTDIGLTFPSLFSIILSLQHLSLYYGLTFSNCPLSLSPISMIQILFSTNISHFPHAPYIFHIHLIFSTNISHFPQMPHIFHIHLTLSTNASHFPQMPPFFTHTSHFPPTPVSLFLFSISMRTLLWPRYVHILVPVFG